MQSGFLVYFVSLFSNGGKWVILEIYELGNYIFRPSTLKHKAMNLRIRGLFLCFGRLDGSRGGVLNHNS